MTVEKLTQVDYWESHWRGIKLPQVYYPADIHEFHQIFKKYLLRSKGFIEIGCAPGKWMAYFNQQFDYFVSGIEYAPDAAALTIHNLELQKISASALIEDFLTFDSPQNYDVVFSAGFIEHFSEPKSIVERIIQLAKPNGGIVITVIPSMNGINRWISKTFRPNVAAGHHPVSIKDLKDIHEFFGIETVYFNYCGCLKLLLPVSKNRFAQNHRIASHLLNLPFRCWNKVIDIITRKLAFYPKVDWLSSSIIYIGRKNFEVEPS